MRIFQHNEKQTRGKARFPLHKNLLPARVKVSSFAFFGAAEDPAYVVATLKATRLPRILERTGGCKGEGRFGPIRRLSPAFFIRCRPPEATGA